MGSAGFHNAVIFRLQTAEGIHKMADGGKHPVLQRQNRRNMHGGGKGIVGGLAHVHIVIGMEQFFSGNLIAPVCNDLIGVHIGLGAGAGLPHHQRKMPMELSANHLVAGFGNGIQLFIRHFFRPEGVICQCCRLFQHAESVDDFAGHGFISHTDGKIFMGALGLRPPIAVSGHLHLAHGIVFNAVIHHGFSL